MLPTPELVWNWMQTRTLLGVTIDQLVVALLVATVAYLVLSIGLRFIRNRLARLAEHTSTEADDAVVQVLGSTKQGLIALVALLIGIGVIELPLRWEGRVGQLWFVALVIQIALWANRLITILLARKLSQHAIVAGQARLSAAGTLISWGLRTVLWSVVLLAMLSNIGINVTAFIASLGVGGIAVALAAQNILGDLFASISIAVDKPFEVGDFVVFGSVAGSIEYVGVKTTRIRSLGGEQIVIANSELLKQTISNYKRLAERRIVFGFGVLYSTTPQQAEQIGVIVREIVEASDRLRFDRAHLKTFGASSLDYEVVYIVLDPGYNVYMDEQQRINLELMRRFEAAGIDFAFPTRTLHIVGNQLQPPGQEPEPAPRREPTITSPAEPPADSQTDPASR